MVLPFIIHQTIGVVGPVYGWGKMKLWPVLLFISGASCLCSNSANKK